MPNSFSQGKGKLVEPSFGTYLDEWDKPCNSNFGLTDALVSGTTTIDVGGISSGTPFVTLVFATFDTTATPWTAPLAGQNIRLLLTGSISFAATIYIPARVPGMWLIDNQTTGSGVITVKTNASGSVGVDPYRGVMSYVFCDGTNVYYADIGGAIYAINKYVPSSVPVGGVVPFAGASVPNTSWLSCNVQAVLRANYPALFSYIGTLYGNGDGSTTFNVPNLNEGAFIRGVGGNAAAQGVLQAESIGPHTHPVTDPGHQHQTPPGVTAIIYATGPGGFPTYFAGGSGGNTDAINNVITDITTTGITIGNNTGAENRPANYSMLYCIRALP
jgi:microcystin-dependent protein